MNKRQMYNRIMESVAKQVKKVLNEQEELSEEDLLEDDLMEEDSLEEMAKKDYRDKWETCRHFLYGGCQMNNCEDCEDYEDIKKCPMEQKIAERKARQKWLKKHSY